MLRASPAPHAWPTREHTTCTQWGLTVWDGPCCIAAYSWPPTALSRTTGGI